jgi:hypothetical protein
MISISENVPAMRPLGYLMTKASHSFKSLVLICAVMTVSLLVLVGLPLLGGKLVNAQETVAAETSTSKGKIWKGPNGVVIPFENNEEVTEFLRTAKVVQVEKLSEGKGGSKRVLLEKDGIKMRAIFRDIELSRSKGPGLRGKIRRNFRDHYRYEVAAYELSQMLGLDNVPPTVIRQIHLEIGSLQIWVENAITENIRQKEERIPPSYLYYGRQSQVMKVFDNLIHNDDRNLGNILFDQNWKLWMIDHTRTFRLDKELSEPEEIRSCEEDLWEKIQTLDEAALRERLGDFLRGTEIDALLARKDLLVEHIQKLIEQKGEKAALFKY